ncbi:hypothetical protein ASD15_04245 [Massilia sp. Root351]|jgi:hypothetical protein|uniref:hypothetical protein n=1 Tax=Massilia sp. Root351 TaxID=1736522 RepID=UPI00070B39E2|nr:hypothetical protein [Massilia sp. Root351]KQV91259.1 hypothetical protein ASD15_04245 [Massilia sp. Root351]
MKPFIPVQARAALVMLSPLPAMLLSGCSSDTPEALPAPSVKVAELAAGAYAVSTGDAANPSAGKYYAAADGSRLLVLNNSAQQATAVYRREGSGAWQAMPAATRDVSLELLGSSPIPSTTINAAAIARNYAVRLAGGGVAAFSVNAGGDIVAGGTSCKLSGKVAASTLPHTLTLSLAASGCGDLPAQSEGFLVVDSDYAPAGFRLLASGATAPVDLWAYPE